MTSFTGPTCSDGIFVAIICLIVLKQPYSSESTAYEFGQGTGLVTFEYPEGRWPNAHKDLLALGFITAQKDDATVLRLDSANSNDFMELEIVSNACFFK